MSLAAFWFGAGLHQHLAQCASLLCGQTQAQPHPASGLPYPQCPHKWAAVPDNHAHRGGDLRCGLFLAGNSCPGWRAYVKFHSQCNNAHWQQRKSSAPRSGNGQQHLRTASRFKIWCPGPSGVVQLLHKKGRDDFEMFGVCLRQVHQLPPSDWTRVSDKCRHPCSISRSPSLMRHILCKIVLKNCGRCFGLLFSISKYISDIALILSALRCSSSSSAAEIVTTTNTSKVFRIYLKQVEIGDSVVRTLTPRSTQFLFKSLFSIIYGRSR